MLCHINLCDVTSNLQLVIIFCDMIWNFAGQYCKIKTVMGEPSLSSSCDVTLWEGLKLYVKSRLS